MSWKTKLIALIVGLILAILALVKLDVWYSSRQAEQAGSPPVEETQP